MATEIVTLHLPSELYQRLRERAEQAQRSVEEELYVVLATAVPVDDGLPPDLAEAVAPLVLMDDEALWKAARSHFPAESSEQLEELHFKRQREGLTENEAATAAALVRQYERTILIRAQATLLLKERGHDISSLVAAA